MHKCIRIGTRDSRLALWQAATVQKELEEKGFTTELIPTKSEGDLDLVTPLYAMGVQGVFTRTLDAHLLSGTIDIAVHSMKDVPVQLAQGIRQAAVLPRGNHLDILVKHPGRNDLQQDFREIATGSIRRKAQWLHRYPGTAVSSLRGNVQTRLRKLEESSWDGAIFAAAGLERVQLKPDSAISLDWMLPAPAQGAIMVVCKEEDDYSFDACRQLNDAATALCVKAERDFLAALMGGCSTPVSAYARMEKGQVIFEGNICSPDGSRLIATQQTAAASEADTIGVKAAQHILEQGGAAIMDEIRRANLK